MNLNITVLNLDPRFEMWVASFICSSPRFYKRIGHAIVPEHFVQEPLQWLVRAAHAIADDNGNPPDSTVLVIQRLRRWNVEGKIKFDLIEQCLDVFETLEDTDERVAEDGVLQELVPIIKRQQHKAVLNTALSDYANNKDLGAVVELVEKANKLGEADATVSRKFTAATAAQVIKHKVINRLPTGVDELDYTLDGGLPKSMLGCIVGGAGDGKSMLLYQIAAIGLVQGCHVALATLENPEQIVFARLAAALTNVPLAEVLNGSDVAINRLGALEPQLGIGSVREFTAKATTTIDIFSWVDELGRLEDRPVDLLVLDYADKLAAPKERDEYNAMRVVYEDLRVGVHARNMWGWTASQAQRRKNKDNTRTDLDDVADSINKARIVDLMIGLAVRDPQQGLTDREVELFVAKYRSGVARVNIGPLPTEFEFGRLTASSLLTNAYTSVAHIK